MSLVGSIALIRKRDEERNLWLTCWNELTECWELPFARKNDDCGFREALEDLLVEELSFTRNRDYIISSVPRLHFQSPLEFPDRCEPVWVVVQFFLVELFGNRARARLDEDTSCRWVSESEILGQEENDPGFDIQMRHLIRQTGIFS